MMWIRGSHVEGDQTFPESSPRLCFLPLRMLANYLRGPMLFSGNVAGIVGMDTPGITPCTINNSGFFVCNNVGTAEAAAARCSCSVSSSKGQSRAFNKKAHSLAADACAFLAHRQACGAIGRRQICLLWRQT